MLGNKPKMIKAILFAIIEPSCFSNYTWSGKAANGRKKNAMQKHPKILELLHKVVKGSDESYDFQLFLKHLKEKVIKYAYE